MVIKLFKNVAQFLFSIGKIKMSSIWAIKKNPLMLTGSSFRRFRCE